MLREVRHVVQQPHEFHAVRNTDPVEQQMSRISAALSDVERANVTTELATLGIVGDRDVPPEDLTAARRNFGETVAKAVRDLPQ